MRRAFIFLLVMLLPLLAFSQTSPLIMKHADSLSVARKRGTLVLYGRVHFVHDSVQFRTQRAIWNKEGEVVQCEGGFKFLHPSGFMDADRGTYLKKQNLASASGNVRAGDSAHTYYITGEFMQYDREKEVLNITQDPVLYQFEKNADGTEDSVVITSKYMTYDRGQSIAEARGAVKVVQKDVTISADKMNYNRSTNIAEAFSNVKINQKDMTISADRMNYKRNDDFAEAFNHVKMEQKDMVVTCDTGYFDHKNNWISMKGNPTCDLKGYHLTGDSIYLVLDSTGNSLKSALVIRNAHGVQREEAKRNVPGSVTEAFGDTLFALFKNNKIEHLYVNLNARGFFYETDLQDYRNLMDGNRLDMFFKKGKMDRAVVAGKAQSTYFYVKNDRSVAGKNEATGDTIHILFDAQKNAVKSLRLLGSPTMASGRYVDMEKENRNKSVKKDSLTNNAEKKDIIQETTPGLKQKSSPIIKRGRRRNRDAERPVEAKN